MDAYVCTLLGFYSVFNSFPIVDASKGPWTTAEDGWAAANVIRRARAVNKPIPINCKLGAWSSWSPCNSCTDKKHRFRYLERPSQFGGSDCVDKLWNTFTCPRATTECLEPDYCEESFTCKGTGRCISQSLRCNGEPDCEDDSDEEGCERVTSRDDKCSTLQPIPGAKRGVQGYNVLTNEFMDPVLDQKYYGGQCEYVYNGEWKKFGYESFCENLHLNEEDKNFRKPYNYHYYRFMAQAASEGSNEYYEDLVDLVKARKKESSSNGGFTVGISYVEVGLKGSSEAKFLTNMTQHNAQDLGFIRLQSQVQTANFKIRSDKLMLHDDLYVSLMELPEQYNFGTYSQFFDTFGTHYVTEGTMGGTLEYIAAVNKTSMAKLGVKGQQVGSCIGATLGISKTISKSVSADLTLRANGCGKTGEYDTVKGAHLDIIEDSVTIVKGGITESSSTLLAIRDPDTYRKWGETLKYNPTLIEFETMPIYELVRLSTAADHVGQRLANLRKAWDEYLLQFNSCRCAPCRHNGIPMLFGTSCRCICKTGYLGQACEETNGRDGKTDGSWSCWGSWSSCQAGRKTRTRACNNPPPDNGGVTCLGSSSQSGHC